MARQNKDSLQKGLWFSILIDSDEFVAFISGEALAEHFNGATNADSPLAIYKKHHEQINAVAEKKFLGGCMRPVKLAAVDFEVDTKSEKASTILHKSLRKSAFSDASGRVASSKPAESQNTLVHYR